MYRYIAVPEELMETISNIFLAGSNEIKGYLTYTKTIRKNEQIFKIQKTSPELGSLLITQEDENTNMIPVYIHSRKTGETVQTKDITLREHEINQLKTRQPNHPHYGIALLIRPTIYLEPKITTTGNLIEHPMPEDKKAINFEMIEYINGKISTRPVYSINKQGILK